jgi:hypothetical protein
VRVWPKGSRHDCTLGLATILLRAGWSLEECLHFVLHLARAAGDEEWRARLHDVRDTAQRLSNGQPVTGAASLADVLGEAVLSRLRDWLQIGDDHQPRHQTSQAQALIAFAAGTELFHTPDGVPCATIRVGGHRETHPVRSRAFRLYLTREYFTAYGKPPSAQALADSRGYFESRAHFDAPEAPVYVRLANLGDRIYLDLANDRWEAIEITSAGWPVVADPPVRFRRPRGMLPLPRPERGGTLDALRPFVNVASDADFSLLLAWEIAALRGEGPFPVAVFHGEQGSGKTTRERVMRRLVDPNAAEIRAEPRDGRDVMLAAVNGWILAYDNLSRCPAWLSDAFCRLSTGGGFATRELYSDSEETLFHAQRPVILNGIEEIISRGDLLDRALVLYLPAIPDSAREPEAVFWRRFEAERPRLLGALLSAVSTAIRNLPSVKLASLPRLADFAQWAVAAEPAFAPSGSFMTAYTGNREAANDLTLEAFLLASRSAG